MFSFIYLSAVSFQTEPKYLILDEETRGKSELNFM